MTSSAQELKEQGNVLTKAQGVKPKVGREAAPTDKSDNAVSGKVLQQSQTGTPGCQNSIPENKLQKRAAWAYLPSSHSGAVLPGNHKGLSWTAARTANDALSAEAETLPWRRARPDRKEAFTAPTFCAVFCELFQAHTEQMCKVRRATVARPQSPVEASDSPSQASHCPVCLKHACCESTSACHRTPCVLT